MGLMRCELCAAYLDEETMVGAGDFFVCPNCAVDDKVGEAMKSTSDADAAEAAMQSGDFITLDELKAELETKH